MPRSPDTYRRNQQLVDRLRCHKTRLGLTCEQIADRAGMPTRVVGDFLLNRYNIPAFAIRPLFEGFGRDMDVLMDLIGVPGVILSKKAGARPGGSGVYRMGLRLQGDLGSVSQAIRDGLDPEGPGGSELTYGERVHIARNARQLARDALNLEDEIL